jgi:hypothetical protein
MYCKLLTNSAEGQQKHMQNRELNNLISFGILLLVVKVFLMSQNTFPLWADEAQYWLWSKNLDLGYYSKPPMISYGIYLTTHFFNDSEFFIRLSSPFVHFFTSIVVFKIAEILYDRKTALTSGCLYLLLPGVSFSSIFISTDVYLMFFFALSILYFLKALRDDSFFKFTLMGVFIGLALLSKYTAIILYPSIGLYLIIEKGLWKKLFSPKLIWGGIVSIAVFSPNLYWNYLNGYVSFIHTNNNVISHEVSLYPNDMIEFIIGQFLILGPILALIFISSIFKKDEEISQKKFLLSFSLPLIFAGTFVALIAGAQMHWAAPGYVCAAIIISRMIIKFNLKKSESLSFALHLSVMVLLYLAAFYQSSEIVQKKFARIYKWNDLTNEVAEISKRYPSALIVTDERKSIANLIYNLRDENGNPAQIFKWNVSGKINDYFDMNYNFKNMIGRDVIFLSRNDVAEDLPEYFSIVEELEIPKKYSPFRVYYARDFLGYEPIGFSYNKSGEQI